MKMIRSEAEYKKTMSAILELMNKGETNQTRADKSLLKSMALAAQEYEKKRFVISPPKTIEGMIELKMYERKLKQKDLARIMGLAEAKLSQILNGKRRPDVSFLKAAHQKLGIDASFLLVHA
jgi:HTH-type transcriptional regulator / antitoxin HigA